MCTPLSEQNESGKSIARNYTCSHAAEIAITIIEGELDRVRDTQEGYQRVFFAEPSENGNILLMLKMLFSRTQQMSRYR